MNKLYIVGVGPGNPNLITPMASETIKNCDILIGGERNLKEINIYNKEEFVIKNNLFEVVEFIHKNIDRYKIAILATGDPFIYGIGSYISENIKDIEIESISGISALQYMTAKINMRAEDIYISSVHGKAADIFSIVKNHKKTCIFTGTHAESILKSLYKMGFGQCKAYVGEMLSYKNEKITEGLVSELLNKSFSDLTIIIIENNLNKKIWKYDTCGINDDMFYRSNVPMTKEEIRALTISKLRLKENDMLCDIGGGTGSVSVEAALLLKYGFVYTYEKNNEAIELIKRNFEKFKIKNACIVEGDVLNTLSDEGFTHIFVGGGGNHIEFILKFFCSKNVRVVINTVTIETTYESLKMLEKYNYKNIECIGVSVSKASKAGLKHIMKSLNTINIISAESVNYYEG